MLSADGYYLLAIGLILFFQWSDVYSYSHQGPEYAGYGHTMLM
jgi:hypothetical protein